MEIYIGKNNTVSIMSSDDECSITLNYNYTNRKEVEGNDILIYSTNIYVCGYSNGVKNPDNKIVSKKYLLIKNLKFSHGSDTRSVFSCKDIKNNVIEMDTITTERDIKINKILNEVG